MNGESSDDEGFDLAALLNGSSDLTPEARRVAYDAIVSGVIEGYVPRRESVLELIELAAGRITGDEYRRRVLARLTHAPAKASPRLCGRDLPELRELLVRATASPAIRQARVRRK